MPFLKSTGRLCLSEIASFFGGTTPHCLSEYYRGGGRVPSTKGSSHPYPNTTYLSGWHSPQYFGRSIIRGMSGIYYNQDPLKRSWSFFCSSGNTVGSRAVVWENTVIGVPSLNVTSFSSGGYTYYMGPTFLTQWIKSNYALLFSVGRIANGAQTPSLVQYEGGFYKFDLRGTNHGYLTGNQPAGTYVYLDVADLRTSSTDNVGTNSVIFWDGQLIGRPGRKDTFVVGNYRYLKGPLFSTLINWGGTQTGQLTGGLLHSYHYVWRMPLTYSSVTNINTGIPSSGRMCMSQFYGAEKP